MLALFLAERDDKIRGITDYELDAAIAFDPSDILLSDELSAVDHALGRKRTDL